MEILLHDERLEALARELQAGEGACPFVVLDPPESGIRFSHFSAGSDAAYVLVERSRPGGIIIGYASFVEGTTLIYDLTDETLQGKARPFACDLRRYERRVYALLPAQIETICLEPKERQIAVEFHDACSERMEAALPFHVIATAAGGRRHTTYGSTDRNGRATHAIPASLGAGPWSVQIRSLLTGRTALATLRW
jgi:hypothetical protein